MFKKMFKKSFISTIVFIGVAVIFPVTSLAAVCTTPGVPSGCTPPPFISQPPTTTVSLNAPTNPGQNAPTNPSGGATSTAGGATFVNPIRYDSVSDVVVAVLSNLRGILVSLALVFIVIGAVMYILSAGDDKKMTSAKATITAAIIGLAIALAAPTFLSEIIKILGGTSNDSGVGDPGGISLKAIITNVLNFLLGIVGILSIIGMVVGGSFYLMAYGDDKRAENGKKMITASVIGIVVALGALAIVSQIAKFFQ